MSSPMLTRRISPPAMTYTSCSEYFAFRWSLEEWRPGPIRQTFFDSFHGKRFYAKLQQQIDKSGFEICFKQVKPQKQDETWYAEVTVHHAYDPQLSYTVYSPIFFPSQTGEAVLVVPLVVSDAHSFLFPGDLLVLDFRFSDRQFLSEGHEPGPGSSLPPAATPTMIMGLRSTGSASYVPSFVQLLFHLPVLRAIVYNIISDDPVVRELQRLFGGLQVGTKVCSTALLMKAISSQRGFNWSENAAGRYRDVGDFVNALLSHLSIAARNATLFSSLLEVSKSSFVISLEVDECKSLESALSRVARPNVLNDEQMDSYDTSHLPPILLINLKRFEWNQYTGRKTKKPQEVTFPKELDFNGLYELVGVLAHTGNSSSGHYLAYLREAPGTQWYQFHDSSVTKSTEDQVTFQNFGGSSPSSAYFLAYVKRSEIPSVFAPVQIPKRLSSLTTDIRIRASSQAISTRSRSKTTKKIKLLVEDDFRRAVLQGYALADCTEIPNECELEEDDTNHDLYVKIASGFSNFPNLIKVWKVGLDRLPTSLVPENQRRCVLNEPILYVEELTEPIPYFDKYTRIAFVSFFFPSATPRVQFLGSVPVDITQTVTQIFHFIRVKLNIMPSGLSVYIDGGAPIALSQTQSLLDMGITQSMHFIVESLLPVTSDFRPACYAQSPTDVINYASLIRPNGDTCVPDYLKRLYGQIKITLYRVSDPQHPVVVISAPESLQVTELPRFILFATHDTFNEKTDTLQIFRRSVDSEENEPTPYKLSSEVTIRHIFTREMKKVPKLPDFRLYYDVVYGYTAEQLAHMIIRTCDVYDLPTHKLRRLRVPMTVTESLQRLESLVHSQLGHLGQARFLAETNGIVREIHPNESLSPNDIVRYDVIPTDQLNMRPDEYLVVACLEKYSKHQDSKVSLRQSFFVKVSPGETMDEMRERLVSYDFAPEKLLPYVTFATSSGRIINGDECLSDFVNSLDVIKIILPDKAKTNSILKEASGR